MAEINEPPMKKMKIVDGVDEFIDNIINSDTNLTAILSDIYFQQTPLIKCQAGHVKDMKLLSTSIRILNEKLPLTDLQHLKRVNKQYVLLCPLNHITKMNCSIQDFLETNVPELKDTFDYFKEVEVPTVGPATKLQHVEFSKKWSCNFHPNKYIEKILSGSCFSKDELHSHRMYMRLACHIAKVGLTKNNLAPTLQDLHSCDLNIAVVVDPSIDSVVTIAFDNRRKHPIQHAAMVAIDNVAKTQNGGAWNGNKESENNTIKEVIHHFSNIAFGARKYVSKKDATENNSIDSSPYLCTGYDIYLLREPCFMCAMGLVHARIKRIFFVFKNLEHGALQSKTKLHCVSSLNHRFEVFTGFDN